jgi:putative oxidoreductase
MESAGTLVVVGRVVLGLFFVIAAIRNALHFSERAALQTNYGFVLPPAVTALGFVMQLIGGLSLTLGVATGWGAGLLILFLLVATALFHNPLMFKGEAQAPHLYFCLVNTALAGSCLMVIGTAT